MRVYCRHDCSGVLAALAMVFAVMRSGPPVQVSSEADTALLQEQTVSDPITLSSGTSVSAGASWPSNLETGIAISNDVPLGSLGQGVFRDNSALWSAAAGTMNRLTVGYTVAFSGMLAAPAAAEIGSAALNRVLFGPALNRVFWYGSGYFAAHEYAEMNEGTMIGDTVAGRALDLFTKPMGGGFGFNWQIMQPYWATASQLFARGAQGPATMFPGITANPSSIWFTHELPALIANGTRVVTMVR